MKSLIYQTVTLLTLFGSLQGFEKDLSFEKREKTAKVRLIDTIAINAPFVTLGEIASIETEDPQLKKQLKSLVVDRAPNLGASKLVSKFKIKRALKNENLLEEVSLLGDRSRVKTATRRADDQEIIDTVKNFLEKEAGSLVEVEIFSLQLPNNWKIPAGEDSEIIVQRNGTQLGGVMSLTLKAKSGHKIFSTTHMRLQAALYKETAVLVRPVKRGQIITERDVKVHRADISKASGMEIADPKELLGMAAKKQLKVGSLLSISDFEAPVLIKRGSTNRVVVANSQVKMQLKGVEALQDGRKGDYILFKNPMNTREPLKARVIRKGVALISFN